MLNYPFCESDYFQRRIFDRVSTIYSIFSLESGTHFLFLSYNGGSMLIKNKIKMMKL